MKYLSSILLGTAASAVMLTSEMAAVAQQPRPPQQAPSTNAESKANIDQEEFQRFANAFMMVQQIQKQSQDKIEQAIRDQGLTVKEYKQFYRQQQQAQGNSSNQSNFSQEKQQKLQQAQTRINQIAQESQGQIKQAIAKEGMEIQRFQQIWKAVRQDPKLQKQLQQQLQQ